MRNHLLNTIITGASLIALAACSAPAVPDNYAEADAPLTITPDYNGTTIPCNIAPLNFRIGAEGSDYVTHLRTKADPDGIVLAGRTIDIPVDRWHALLDGAKGDSVYADVYVKGDNGWLRYPAIANAVADSIDSFISYRLIEPSYIGFETMAICQRNISNFDESEILNNQALSTEEEGQCLNCHSYQAYNRDGNMQMHVRIRNGGTLIKQGDKLKKINLKAGKSISAGVYPAWHPTENIIAYSQNETTQSFHNRDINKIEVQDAASDLILYDVDRDEIKFIANDTTELETFPYWHPDGNSLWYVSASVPPMTSEQMKEYENTHYKDFKYDLYRKPFDKATRTFGPTDTVFRASAYGMSATHPRPSPDGRFLVFTMGEFGTFHIWHRDADLYLLDIEKDLVRPMKEINSHNVDSYHSWSSNGRWLMFSTRRDDGSYTRLYLTYFDPKGFAHKPFALPQRTPDFDPERMKSYNVPEFMVCPVKVSKRDLIETIESDPVNVKVVQ